MHLHHATLFVRDAERSLRFYRDGLGLTALVDREFDGPWPELFDVRPGRLRAVILGDAENPQTAQVELLTFTEPVPAGASPESPSTGTVMLSFHAELATVVPALEAAGATDVRRATLRNGYAVATLRDPDGVLVELIDTVPPTQVPA